MAVQCAVWAASEGPTGTEIKAGWLAAYSGMVFFWPAAISTL